MSDEAALLAAIIAYPDEDTPRLAYADWLDENAPDTTPSPAASPSARAEYIRVQCRLARRPYDDPDYPDLLEREQDLAAWLQTHTKDPARPEFPDDFDWDENFDSGPDRAYDRGFAEVFRYTGYYDDGVSATVDRMLGALPGVLAGTTARTLELEDSLEEEIAGLVRGPAVAGLRGLAFINALDEFPETAVRAIATSRHLSKLKRLRLGFDFEDDEIERFGSATNLRSLESLTLDELSVGIGPLGQAGWFRNLRSLRLSMLDHSVFKSFAELPPMPNLVDLTIDSLAKPAAADVRAFAESDSFPRLRRLELRDALLTPEQVAILAQAPWGLRELSIHNCEVRKAGAEAIANAPFAGSLRVLELSTCDITAGGVQAIARSEKLAGLKHLNLAGNPVGIGGLMAIARSDSLRGLRRLVLPSCNTTKAAIDAASMLSFLAALEMPELRHLDLDWMPVGVRGARVIGGGSSFANLTRLRLNDCNLQEKGVRAVVESDSLTNLVHLDLAINAAKKGVAKLSDPRVLPRLGWANVAGNRVPSKTLSRLRKRPGVQV